MRKVQLIFLALLSINALFAQNIYYVSTNGSNTNIGSENSPWATIDFAVDQVKSQDTIILRSGTYDGDITIETSHITIKSFDGEFAHISSPSDDDNIAQTIWFNALGGRLINVEVSGGYFYAVKFEQGDGYVKSCKIHSSGRDCIKIVPEANNIEIEDCEIYNSGQRDNSNAEGIDNVNGDGMVVRRCYIHDIATNGAYAKGGARNTIFESNLVMNCGGAGITLGFFTSLEFFDPGENPNYHGNIDGIVRNNIIVNTDGPGIGMFAALRPKVFNNTLVGVANSQRGGIHFEPVENNEELRKVIDPQIINNIIIMDEESSRTVIEDRNDAISGSVTFSNNIYHDEDGIPQFRYNSTILSFSDWVNSVSGGDEGSMTSAPLLDGNYHLTENSPARNNGSTEVGDIIDYDGSVRISHFDIGADEFDSQCGITPTPPSTGTIGTGALCAEDVVSIPLSTSDAFPDFVPYPNPTSHYIEVSDAFHTKLYDLNGKEVAFSIINSKRIGITTLKPGSYILTDTKNNFQFHIIKQ